MAVRIGFVGTGYISKIHGRAFQIQPDVELVAVADIDADAMSQFVRDYGIPQEYSDLDSLLRDGEVDGLVVGVPNHLHASYAIAALEQGVHVMLEKPMAANAEDAKQVLEASERTGSLLMVGHCWRFETEVRWLREQVSSGKLGKIVRTKGYGVHVNWGPSGWFTQASCGGGAVADMGIHAIDTARFLLGDPQPVSVYARLGTYYGEFDVDDTGIIIVNWDNDATSYIESGWWQPHADGPEAATQLYGTAGFGQLFPTYLTIPDRESQTERREDPGFPSHRDPHCPQSMYDSQAAYFVSCIRNGVVPVPGGLEGWINMKIVDAAHESAHTGKVVGL